jgi:hypothetical protein
VEIKLWEGEEEEDAASLLKEDLYYNPYYGTGGTMVAHPWFIESCV